MKRLALLLLAFSLPAQEIPGRYLVELTEPPALDWTANVDRASRLHQRNFNYGPVMREQTLFRLRLWHLGGRDSASISNLVNAVSIEIPPHMVDAVRRLPEVRAVYPVRRLKPVLDAAPQVHHVPEAWARSGGIERAGEGMKIGIVDSCIDVGHPAFQDPLLPMPPGYPRVSRPAELAFTSNKVIVTRNYRPMYGDDGDAAPDSGHGTGVAAAAAGSPHNSPNGLISGVAPMAWLGNYCAEQRGAEWFRDDVIAKAIDDAVADGMDVVNLSLGSVTEPLRPKDDILAKLVERAFAAGTIVISSAGNSGEAPNTIGDLASLPAMISVGATWNSRIRGVSVEVGPDSYLAMASGGTEDLAPVTATVVDVKTLDGDGFGCGDLPDGSLTGKIAFMTLGGNCKTSSKAKKAAAAGAVAALIAASESVFDLFRLGERAIPTISIGHTEGRAVRARLAADQETQATLRFQSSPMPFDANHLADFSSRGPTAAHAIKPDLVATGVEFYTAALENGYVYTQGTSLSAPFVAGAAAALKAARPGLSLPQYRSLLINSAAEPRTNGPPAKVMWYGAGILDLDAAVTSTVAVAPTSLNFGVPEGDLDQTIRLLVMNLGASAARLTVNVRPHAGGPAPTVTPGFVDLPAKGARPVAVRFLAPGLAPGEHQGIVEVVAPDGSIARVPYWAAVPMLNRPRVVLLDSDSSGEAGSTLRTAIVFRATDVNGVNIPDAVPAVVPVSGGGVVERVISRHAVWPAQWWVDVTLGVEPGMNVFRIEHGDASQEVYIEGKAQ